MSAEKHKTGAAGVPTIDIESLRARYRDERVTEQSARCPTSKVKSGRFCTRAQRAHGPLPAGPHGVLRPGRHSSQSRGLRGLLPGGHFSKEVGPGREPASASLARQPQSPILGERNGLFATIDKG